MSYVILDSPDDGAVMRLGRALLWRNGTYSSTSAHRHLGELDFEACPSRAQPPWAILMHCGYPRSKYSLYSCGVTSQRMLMTQDPSLLWFGSSGWVLV